MRRFACKISVLAGVFFATGTVCLGQSPLVTLDALESTGFAVAAGHSAAAIYIAPQNPDTVRTAAEAFASDVEKVTGTRPRMLPSLAGPLPDEVILVGVLGQSPEIDALVSAHRIDVAEVAGRWESALTVTVANPMPGVKRGLVVAGSDRRGAAYALFTLSRAMGVSPWNWWADVPVPHHAAVYVTPGAHLQREPSVQYRGIFLNDEDWGLRPWAAKVMDPEVGNFGPHTYERIFELLLRLHANSLWPAMHPGTLAFNAIPENARLANKWGIVMGSSHSEALLRNNVGEWNEAAPPKGDGPWNYQINSARMKAYWDRRLAENGRYENFYTVGLRGVHDTGLEATGTPQVKARLVEEAIADQRKILAAHLHEPLAKVPQVIWLYKESLDLYRAGMKVPDDVTLGWTDDNYGYLRELPNAAEQARAGSSGVYYHVSYWGSPHDYLWLCSTPPALIREEMTKAYDHNARKYWVLNVGDIKPAEIDIDYFMQLAWDEPGTAALTQREWLTRWMKEQFAYPDSPPLSQSGDMNWMQSKDLAGMMGRYYALNFIRRPEFMGFNGYNDDVKRTEFNPQAWGDARASDQNRAREAAWTALAIEAKEAASQLPKPYQAAFFELVEYPILAAAAMNEKFLAADRTYLDVHNRASRPATGRDAAQVSDDFVDDVVFAQSAYDTIQSLTAKYNALEGGKWNGILSSHPRDRHVFDMPRTATMADANAPLPAAWRAAAEAPAPAISPGFVEQSSTVSINAAHFSRKSDGALRQEGQPAHWTVLPDLGISGASVEYGSPGLLANESATPNTGQPTTDNAPSLEYDFTTISSGPCTLTLHLLPTFPVDSSHRLRYAVSIDGHPTLIRDAAPRATTSGGAENTNGDGPADTEWPQNVLRNSAVATMQIASLAPGAHTLRLIYIDPGVVFEHLVLTFPGAPPAYPVPPETGHPAP